MRHIGDYLITESRYTYKECPGYSFDWIAIKDRWASKGSPRYKYSLVVYPDKKDEDIIVFRDFAYYRGGYDQGHASSYQYYLHNIMGGGGGNGSGLSGEVTPGQGELVRYAKDLYDYLTKGKHWSEYVTKDLDDAKMTFDRKTKKSEIKQRLDRGW